MASQGYKQDGQDRSRKTDGLVLPGRVDDGSTATALGGTEERTNPPSSAESPVLTFTTALKSPQQGGAIASASAPPTKPISTNRSPTNGGGNVLSPSSAAAALKRKRCAPPPSEVPPGGGGTSLASPPPPVTSPYKRRKIYRVDFPSMVSALTARNERKKNQKSDGPGTVHKEKVDEEDSIFLATDEPLLRMTVFSCPLHSRFCKPQKTSRILPETSPPPGPTSSGSEEGQQPTPPSRTLGVSIWNSREWTWKRERDRYSEFSSLYHIPSQKGRKRLRAHEPPPSKWTEDEDELQTKRKSSCFEGGEQEEVGRSSGGGTNLEEQAEVRSSSCNKEGGDRAKKSHSMVSHPYQWVGWESDIVWDDSLASFKGTISNVSVEGWKDEEYQQRQSIKKRDGHRPGGGGCWPFVGGGRSHHLNDVRGGGGVPPPSSLAPSPPSSSHSATSCRRDFIEMSLQSRKSFISRSDKKKTRFSLPDVISADKLEEKFEDPDTEWTAAGGEGEGDWMRVDSHHPAASATEHAPAAVSDGSVNRNSNNQSSRSTLPTRVPPHPGGAPTAVSSVPMMSPGGRGTFPTTTSVSAAASCSPAAAAMVSPVPGVPPTATTGSFLGNAPPPLKSEEILPKSSSGRGAPLLWCSYGPSQRNVELDRGEWLESVVWDEDDEPTQVPKPKLIIDLNDKVIDYDPLPEQQQQDAVGPEQQQPASESKGGGPPPMTTASQGCFSPYPLASSLSFSRKTPPSVTPSQQAASLHSSTPSPVAPSHFSSPLLTPPPSYSSPSSSSYLSPSPSPFPSPSLSPSSSSPSSSLSPSPSPSPSSSSPSPSPRTPKEKASKRTTTSPLPSGAAVYDGAPRPPPAVVANMVYYFPSEDPFNDLQSSDPFNLSLDMIYSQTAKVRPLKRKRPPTEKKGRHTVPAMNLSTFPTSYTSEELREFRRPKIRISRKSRCSVVPLRFREADLRRREKIPEGWGKKKQDFSAVNGELILVEHLAEEFPMMLTAPGMTSDIVNYYRKERLDDTSATQKARAASVRHGRLRVLEHNQEPPFFGSVTKGKFVRLMENTLYMVPLSEHKRPEGTFLLVRDKSDKKKFHLRPCRSVYAAGQEQMLKEIHTPNSRATTTIVKNRLQCYIYRMFGKKKTRGIVKHADIDLAFPGHSDSSIRKCLKDCGSFRRNKDGVFWTLKPSVHLPSEEELRGMVSPEDVCIVESVMAGLQRLQDDGVHRFKLVEDFLHVIGGLSAETKKDAKKVEDLLHMTAWNLSSNFVNAFAEKGNIRLAVKFNEAIAARQFGDSRLFSFVRRKEQKIPKVKDPIASTHADLRKLGTADAKLYLMKFGYTEMHFESLTRWDLIQIVRECSSKAAAKGQTGDLAMFARGPRYFANDYSRKYLKDIHDTFEEQLKFIGETDTWSFSDSEDEDEDDHDHAEDAEILENYMAKQANTNPNAGASKQQGSEDSSDASGKADEDFLLGKDLQLLIEEERLNSLKEKKKQPPKDAKAEIAARFPELRKGRRVVLKRTRTVKDADGGESLFVDYIREPNHVLGYLEEKTLPPPPVTPLGSIGFGGQRRKILRKAPPPRKKKSPEEEGGASSSAQQGGREYSSSKEPAVEPPAEEPMSPVSSDEDEEEMARVERTGEGKLLIIRKKETKEKTPKEEEEDSKSRLVVRLSLNRSGSPASPLVSPGSSPSASSPHYSPQYSPSPRYVPSPHYTPQRSSKESRKGLSPSSPASMEEEEEDSSFEDPPVQSPSSPFFDDDLLPPDSPSTPIYEECEEDELLLAQAIKPPEFRRPHKRKPSIPQIPSREEGRIQSVVVSSKTATLKPNPPRISIKVSSASAAARVPKAASPIQRPAPPVTPQETRKRKKRSGGSLTVTIKKPVKKLPKLEEAETDPVSVLPKVASYVSEQVSAAQVAPPKNMKERMRMSREERRNKFHEIVQALYAKDGFIAFREPVSRQQFPDYHLVIKEPMCLSKMAQKAKRGRYKARFEFLADMGLIAQNCRLYCETRFPDLLPEADKIVRECLGLLQQETDEWWEEREELRQPGSTPGGYMNSEPKLPAVSAKVRVSPSVVSPPADSGEDTVEEEEDAIEEEDVEEEVPLPSHSSPLPQTARNEKRVSLAAGKLVIRFPTPRSTSPAPEPEDPQELDTPPHPGSDEDMTESDPDLDFEPPQPRPPPPQPQTHNRAQQQQREESQQRKTLVVVKKAGFKIRFTSNNKGGE